MRTKAIDNLWQELELELRRHGLPERLIFAVADAALGYRVRNSSYRNLAILNDITASRDLRAAVESGLLIPDGERRGRVYIGSPPIKALFDKIKREHIRQVPNPFLPQNERLPFGN